MDTNRTVALWESPYDLHKLSDNGFSFCIAKSVIDSQGNLTYNLVWKSLALSPRSTVTWTVQYGLNWTLDIPTGNAQVTIGGIWQACDPGQVFDVDKFGLFQPSSVASRPGFLTVGKNNYRYDGTSGIHIIVGVQTPAGDFEAVYVDTTELALNMSAWYQPQEQAQWWYEKGVRSTTMITGAKGEVCNYDLTKKNPVTDTYFVSTTYKYEEGIWSTSPNPPPSVRSVGLLGAERKPGGDSESDPEDPDLDQIRKDVTRILKSLDKFSRKGRVQDPGSEIFIGLLTFATAGACVHGARLIVNKLVEKGYSATFKIEAGDLKATVTIKAPKKFKGLQTTGGGVPKEVVNDWNAAVAADAADHPINDGIKVKS